MAGSYRHIVDSENKLILENGFIENMGDAYEALEECYHLIDILSGGDKNKIADAHLKYIERIGGNIAYASKSNFWH